MSKPCIKQFNVLYSIPPKITYSKLFWLYIAGSLSGTGLEGVFCVFKYGHWETHVVSLLGPFCIIYGIGAVGCYVGYTILYRKSKWIQFTLYVLMGFSLELLCGLLLEFGLSMRAWNYSNHFFNIRGHVSLQMSLVWGIVGMAFSIIVPYIEVVLSKAEKKTWKVGCAIFTAIMAVDILLTSAAICRWSGRHFDIPPSNVLEQTIDQRYNDEFMKKRFCEWQFLTKPILQN